MNVYEGLNAYTTYLAIRNHFTTSYDYFKYNGKLKVSSDSFLKRRDKFFFAKLQRNYKDQELVYFFVSNFLQDESAWSGSLVGAESEKVYTEWRKRIESLKYNFKQECNKLQNELDIKGDNFESLLSMDGSNHPLLLRRYLGNDVSIEAYAIIDGVLNFSKRWNKNLSDDLIYQKVQQKVDKYKPFLQVNLSDYRKIMKQVFING